MNKIRKKIFGVGINDTSYAVNPVINGKRVMCPYYQTWSNMIRRCYSVKYQLKYPTYIGCSVTKGWLHFSVFKEWMIGQKWQGKALDKDLLVPYNKVYSPETCVFVSRDMNLLLSYNLWKRGCLPLGVTASGKRFRSQIFIRGKQTNIGSYKTAQEASTAYRNRKAEHLVELANEQDDIRIKEALILHSTLVLTAQQ